MLISHRLNILNNDDQWLVLSDLISNQAFDTVDYFFILEIFLYLASRILFWFIQDIILISRILLHIFNLLNWLLVVNVLCYLFFFILLNLLTLNMTPQIMSLLLYFVLPILNLLMVWASSVVWNVTSMLRMPAFTFWPRLSHGFPDNYLTPPSGCLIDWTAETPPGAPHHLSQITTHLFQISSCHSRFLSFLHTPCPVFPYYILLSLSTLIIPMQYFLKFLQKIPNCSPCFNSHSFKIRFWYCILWDVPKT